MRPAADSSLLAEMTRAVVETVNPEQVLVFGSHARGDATAESDVDLLVVESQSRSVWGEAVGRSCSGYAGRCPAFRFRRTCSCTVETRWTMERLAESHHSQGLQRAQSALRS